MSTLTPVLPRLSEHLKPTGINRKAISAGLTILMSYLFAGLTVQVGILAQLDISAAESARWFFITWMTTGLFSLVLAVFLKQPLSVNLSLPVMILFVGAAGGFSLPEILGANLVVGIVVILLSALKLSESFTKLVPPQVALAVFAGGTTSFMVKTGGIAINDLGMALPVLGGYLTGVVLLHNHLLGVGFAAVSGFAALSLSGNIPPGVGPMALPEVGISPIEFDLSAIVALGIPILALTFGVGNIQALAIVRSEGYKLKANLLGLAVGITTITNAFGGGQAASLGGTTSAVASNSSAGPSESRYWAVIVSSIPVIVVALFAVPVIEIVQSIPLSLTLTVGALAMVPAFRVIAMKSIKGPMRASGIAAMAISVLPIQLLDMPMAFWALVTGTIISMALKKVMCGEVMVQQNQVMKLMVAIRRRQSSTTEFCSDQPMVNPTSALQESTVAQR